MSKRIINLFSGLLVSKKISGSCQKNVRVNSGSMSVLYWLCRGGIVSLKLQHVVVLDFSISRLPVVFNR